MIKFNFCREMEECGRPTSDTTTLVIGGTKFDRGAWPWLVAFYTQIKDDLSFTCGATLISKTAALTAAHCLYSDILGRKFRINEVLLAVGHYNIKQWLEPDTQTKSVVQLLAPESFTFGSQIVNDADIALVIMASEVIYSQFVQPICLWSPAKDQEDVAGKMGVVVGWGRDENSEKTNTPRMVTVKIISEIDCLRAHETYKSLTSNRTLCAGDLRGRGPCTGDSGDGLVMKRNDHYVLRGIVSSSLRDLIAGCDVYKYAVYTDISKYIDWIDENLQEK
jgi:secreted trypsin-like serine protease